MIRILDELLQVEGLERFLFLHVLVIDLTDGRSIVHGLHSKGCGAVSLATIRVFHAEGDFFRTIPILVRNHDLSHALAIDRNLELRSITLRGTLSRLHVKAPGELIRLVVSILHDVVQVNDCKFTLFRNALVLDRLHEFRNIVHGFNLEGHRTLVRSAFRVSHREGNLFSTIPILVRSGNGSNMLRVDYDLEVLVARHSPLELGIVMVFVRYELVEFDRLEFALFLDGLVSNILHDRRVVDGLDSEHSVRLSRSAFRVSHREGYLFRTVPVLGRLLDGGNAVGINFNLELLVTRDRPLEALEGMIRVRSEISKLDRSKFLLFFDHLVRDLLEGRHVVHGLHRKESLRSSLGTFGVSHREGDFVSTVPVLVRNLDVSNMLGIDFNREASVLAVGRLHVDRELEVRKLVIEVTNHFAELDRLKLFLFLDGLRSDLLREFRNVVHGFNRVSDSAFIRCTFRVSHLDGERFRTVPLRRRRGHLHHAAFERDLEFAVARNSPLELILGVVEVFDILVELNRLEGTLFLDGLFSDILHGRRVVDRLDSKLELSRSLATFRVSSSKGNGFRTVPEFGRGLERNFASLVIQVNLDVLVTCDVDLQLGEIVVGIGEIVIKHDRCEFVLFFDSLVRDFLEHRNIVDRLDGVSDLLLCSCAFRVRHSIGHDSGTVPARVRDFNGSNMVVTDVYRQSTGLRFLALVLHVGFPGKFRILVVSILHVFIELDLSKGLLFVDGLVRDLLHDLRNIVHGVHREAVFRFSASASRVADLELEGFRTVPHLVRNLDGCGLASNIDRKVLVTRNSPLKLFERMIRILDQLVQFDRLEFLLFFDRLVLDILHKFRSVVHRLDGELGGSLCRSTGRVGHREGHGFGTIPEFVRDLDIGRTVLVDIELEVLIARNAPLELHDIVIDVGHEVRKANGFEFVLFFDRLVRNLLDNRSIVNRLHHEVCGLGIGGVFAIGSRKLDLGRTIPVRIGDNDRSDAVRIDFHIQVAFSLILAHRLDVEFPKNLVLRVVGVGHIIIEFDLGKGLTFFDSLIRNLLDFRRVVHGFNAEINRFRTRCALGVGSNKGDIFGTVPILVRNFDRRYAVRRNRYLELLVAGHGPLDFFGFVHVIGNILVQLNRSKFFAFIDGFTRNTHH